MGCALENAAVELRAELFDLASDLLKAPASELATAHGQIWVAGSPSRTLGEVIRRSRLGNLIAEATNRSEGKLDPETGQGRATARLFQSAAGAEVEVDLRTGRIEVVDLHSQTYVAKVLHRTVNFRACGSDR